MLSVGRKHIQTDFQPLTISHNLPLALTEVLLICTQQDKGRIMRESCERIVRFEFMKWAHIKLRVLTWFQYPCADRIS